jgi:hypothetical protein
MRPSGQRLPRSRPSLGWFVGTVRKPPRITTAEPGRVRAEGAADVVTRRGGEKVATRLRLPRFAARHEAIETLISGPGVSAGRTFPAGMGSQESVGAHNYVTLGPLHGQSANGRHRLAT